MSKIYFGGSRHFTPTDQSVSVVRAVVLSGAIIHVGCQKGADQSVLSYVGFFAPSQLQAFAVAPNRAAAPLHVQQAPQKQITYSAGGNTAPMPARFLLRSIAAFQGCAAAVFFQPGHGSLAVAREAIRAGLPVYAINPTAARYPVAPLAIPSTSGSWVRSLFLGRFLCWRWSAPAQLSLF